MRLRDVNTATLQLFGATAKDELLGSLARTFLPETELVFLEELLAIAAGRRVFTAETAVRTLAGERLEVLVTLGLPPPESSYEQVLVTVVDISARRQVEAAREARLLEMEHAVSFGEKFVGMLGHDLRSPLNSIMIASDLILRRSETDERVARPLQRIRLGADRMSRMIEQILDFTRARIGGGIPVRPVSVDLRELAGEIVGEFEGSAAQEVVVEAAGDPCGEWDRDRLAQVLSNLLGNAIEHGAVEVPIRVALDGSSADAVSLSIRNGGAIPADQLDAVFDPFRRAGAHAIGGSRSRGLGLGLYIVQQIVAAHGGTIGVTSSQPAGTTFSLSLPRRPRAAAR